MPDRMPYLPPESQGLATSCQRLRERKILIVGGGQNEQGLADAPMGNGRAMAILFAREGASVAVADKNLASAQAACDLIGKENHRSFALHKWAVNH